MKLKPDQKKIRPESNDGIRTHDVCDTGAVFQYQLSYQTNWGPGTLRVRNIPVDDKEYNSGADPGFFLRGGAPLRNDVTDR